MSDDGWTWELSVTAQDDIESLSADEQDRILDKLDEIVDSPWRDPPEYGEPLQNSPYTKSVWADFDSRSCSIRACNGSSSHAPSVAVARTLQTTTDPRPHRIHVMKIVRISPTA
jgi:hypothetical protein